MQQRFRDILIVIILIVAIFTLSIFQPARARARQGFNLVLRPLYRIKLKLDDYYTIIRTLDAVVVENSVLEQQNNELRSQVEDLKEVKRENILLKEQLGIAPSKQAHIIAASVIGTSPQQLLQSVIIDKGSAAGIKKGAPALSHGFLIGLVDQVDSYSSVIQLITSHRMRLAIKLQESRTIGLLRGGLQGVIIEDIPIDVSVREGETVVTAGQSEGVRAGIPVGSIGEIISGKSEIQQTLSVKIPTSLRSLDLVFIEANE